jgi:hypothetical protein
MPLARCPVCGTSVEGGAVECPHCGVPHHRECWEYQDGCGIFGCAKPPPQPANAGNVSWGRRLVGDLRENRRAFLGLAVVGYVLPSFSLLFVLASSLVLIPSLLFDLVWATGLAVWRLWNRRRPVLGELLPSQLSVLLALIMMASGLGFGPRLYLVVAHQRVVVAAIEHYQRDHGFYPRLLEDLIPRYVKQLPDGYKPIYFDQGSGYHRLEGTEEQRYILRNLEIALFPHTCRSGIPAQ